MPKTLSESCQLPILFFSRGRGHGHAVPDMAIADELAKLRNDIDLRFVSYGTGAATFRVHHQPLIDLNLPDANPLWATIVRAGSVIREVRPHLIISHEEFVVLPLTKIFGIPAVFITEWFSEAESLPMQALEYADEILLIENEGIFEEPPSVKGKVYYTGPVLRAFSYGRADRKRAREELGLPQDATVILVAPGGWATEDKEPIYELLLAAFDRLKAPRKLLVWLAGSDCAMLSERLAGREDVKVKGYDWQMDRLMAASDMAITKANRITLKELAALGVPSVSISQGRNPIDDVLIERIPSNTTMDARTVVPKMLAASIAEILGQAREHSRNLPTSPPESQGARLAAQRLADYIEKLKLSAPETASHPVQA
jgi:UDP-N-acetylglucosamine:LPS N-acetylglucosamine transferase